MRVRKGATLSKVERQVDRSSRQTYRDSHTAVLPEKGQRYYSKAHDFDDLNDGAIEVVVEQARNMKGEFTSVYFYPTGGAISDVAENATAFASRNADYGFHCIAGWRDAADDDEVMSWASQLQDEMAPHSTGGVYVLQIADDEDQRIPDAYGTNYSRLQELKGEWDPENVFQSNYNIVPA